jgi:hypothetical protein
MAQLLTEYLSPVVIFAYNRPLHTQNLLDSLSLNEESARTILYIICDGPKSNATQEEKERIKEVIDIVKAENRFGSTVIIERQTNKGLASSIIDGVKTILDKHETVIVLEDDLVVSRYFLYYMNDSLVRYQNNPKVGQIGSCNMFACGDRFPKSFFIPMPDCLGWATWKNRWAHFNIDAKQLLEQLMKNNLIYKFNVYGSYEMKGMLIDQIKGKGNSWAVRWAAVCVLNDWLILYPNPSFTNHIESTNATNASFSILPPLCKSKPKLETVDVVEIKEVIRAMKRCYDGTGDFYGNFKYRFFTRLKKRSDIKWQKLKDYLKKCIYR